ncbi:hypothetical protein AVEN_37337-1 [Araneus ventricosus]|uniref:Uncharacterized protein n=1 Tax=Araneus ventricosus TaxID=182803 RepID=A0A4Y2PH96_ARAVE|nr:hypothetical protein AVEN_37337-1 [Araneus ventricosus]
MSHSRMGKKAASVVKDWRTEECVKLPPLVQRRPDYGTGNVEGEEWFGRPAAPETVQNVQDESTRKLGSLVFYRPKPGIPFVTSLEKRPSHRDCPLARR